MKNLQKYLIILIIVLVAAGMAGHLFLGMRPPFFLPYLAPAEDSFARDYLMMLENGDLIQAEGRLALYLPPSDHKALTGVRNVLMKLGPPESMHLLNVTFSKAGPQSQPARQLSYYADFNKGSLLIQIRLLVGKDRYWVDLLKYQSLPQRFEQASKFHFAGASPSRYFFLGLTVFVVIFSLYALALCLNSNVRRKWLWAPFIILGLCKATLVWNSPGWKGDDFRIIWIAFQLFGGSVSKDSFFKPWSVSISIPLGAILFLLFYRRSVAEKISANPAKTENDLRQGDALPKKVDKSFPSK